jgi:cell division protein FtsB
MSGNRRVKTPRERRRQKLAFWGMAAILVGYAVLGGDYKFHHLLFLASEKDRVARRIEELRAENTVLADQEQRLQGDTLLLEQLAREKGMKKKGEIVYRIVPVTPNDSTSAGTGKGPAGPDPDADVIRP